MCYIKIIIAQLSTNLCAKNFALVNTFTLSSFRRKFIEDKEEIVK